MQRQSLLGGRDSFGLILLNLKLRFAGWLNDINIVLKASVRLKLDNHTNSRPRVSYLA